LDFYVGADKNAERRPGAIHLRARDWNDWFEFRTEFWLEWIDEDLVARQIGLVKIGKLGHAYVNERGQETPLPTHFQSLSRSEYVSLGQSEDYYKKLRHYLGAEHAKSVLSSLRDLALEPARLSEVREQRVVAVSLMREIPAATIRHKFNRIIEFGGGLAAFDFFYRRPSESHVEAPPTELQFSVSPDSHPPTNVHVLIGRNGSGKTTILRSMARAMLGETVVSEQDGGFETAGGDGLDIANLVYVAFSAFDEAKLPVLDKQVQYNVPYSYVGLQAIKDQKPDPPGPELPEDFGAEKYTRAPTDLQSDFVQSARLVIAKRRAKSWATALETLESDPNFDEADVSLLAQQNPGGIAEAAEAVWARLSTGHRIVLLTVTRLVETVTERTLVLVDEPEGHLHPPLLSALVRALSNLLKEQNGVAIVATHSPVILQEVPRKCAWKVRRVGLAQIANRPQIETFGESVGALTSEVFSLEVTDSGFHKLLAEFALKLGSYQAVVDEFNGELGFEARAVLRAMFAEQNA
jgi:predicted ATPase